jgi:hypothetical protein
MVNREDKGSVSTFLFYTGSHDSIFDKIGLPKNLAWGYLGIMIFMMGDGLEGGWLSPYIQHRGLSMQESALWVRFLP